MEGVRDWEVYDCCDMLAEDFGTKLNTHWSCINLHSFFPKEEILTREEIQTRNEIQSKEKILTSKGIYPSDYMDSFMRFKETQLLFDSLNHARFEKITCPVNHVF